MRQASVPRPRHPLARGQPERRDHRQHHFVAECSCERFNRYLDRALVVPTMGHPAELAFFGGAP
jgi:hypothetical protein